MSSSLETLLKDLKALFQFARRPMVWIPGFLVPLTVTALWAYLSHPEWLEATTQESARTGKTAEVDANGLVTSADLDLDSLSTVAETGDLSVLVNPASLSNALPTLSDRAVSSQGEEDEQKGGQPLQDKASSNSTNAEKNNPFTPAVLALQDRLSNKDKETSTPAAESSLQQAIDRLSGTGVVSNQPQEQAPKSATQGSSVLPSASTSRTLPYAYPIRPGVGSYTLPSQDTSPGGTASNTPTTSQGTTSNSVILPRGTSLQQRGNSRWGQTPYGLTPIRPRGGNIDVTDSPVNCAYLRSRGSTGCTTTPNNLNRSNTPTQSQQPFNNQNFLNNNSTTNSGLNNNSAFPNNANQVGVPNTLNSTP